MTEPTTEPTRAEKAELELSTATGLLKELADREPCYETGCPDLGTPLESWCHSCRVRAFLATLDEATTDKADETRGDKSR